MFRNIIGMGNHCSTRRSKSAKLESRKDSNSLDHTSLRHSIVAAVPDVSIAALYPTEDNYINEANGLRSPKSLAELATDALCRSLSLLEGELPAGLPGDVVDNVVRSLICHAALTATTLRILRQCPVANLSLAHCRGVTDQWLAPLRGSPAPPTPSCDASEEAMQVDYNHGYDDEEQHFFNSLETKHSSEESSCSTDTFCSTSSLAKSPAQDMPTLGSSSSVAVSSSSCLTSQMTALDLRGSQRLTDRGLLQLTDLSRLEIAKLDHCHSLQGRGLLALARSHHLHTLSLQQCRRLTDEAVLNISHLVSLEHLNLAGCRCLTNVSLAAVADLVHLRALDLSQCDLLTDAGLDMLARLYHLEELSLGWCRSLTDAGVSTLSKQSGRAAHLRILRLARCALTDMGVGHLVHLTALEELDLNGCHRLSSDATGKALSRLQNLTTLDVSYCPNIIRSNWQGKINKVRSLELSYAGVRDSHLMQWTHMPALEELNMDSCPMGDQALGHLSNRDVTPNLRSLDLADTDLTDAGMAHIAKFGKLQRLSIFYCDVTNRGLRHIAQLVDLETLNLDSRDISDEGLRHLHRLTKLKHLDMFSGRITDTGCGHLSKIKSLETLELCGGSIGDTGCSLLGNLEKLTSLNLSQNERITNRGAAALAALTKLKALNLSNTRVDGRALCYFSNLYDLQSLSLYGCPGMDRGSYLNTLRDGLPKLKCLRLNSVSESEMDGRVLPTTDSVLDQPMEESDSSEEMDVYSDHD